jgi:hypothetical protein
MTKNTAALGAVLSAEEASTLFMQFIVVADESVHAPFYTRMGNFVNSLREGK